MSGQPNRHHADAGDAPGPIQPAPRASAPGRYRQPRPLPPAPVSALPKREQRHYAFRPVPGVPDEALAALSHEDLLNLRDKVAELLGEGTRSRTRIPPAVRLIMQMACDDAGIDLADMLSRRRADMITNARQRAMASVAALRTPAGERRFSRTQVGHYFNRDHTTVSHAMETVPESGLIRL